MSRYRLEPSATQEAALLRHCSDARYLWNLCVEQESHWRRGRSHTPGFAERCRQLTEARADNPWLAEGSVIVQQQAIRDHAQAMTSFFAGVHNRPSWRKAGGHEGFRIVHLKPSDVRRLSRNAAQVRIPKAGWVRFRWSRLVPDEVKSFRVTLDRAGRWHVAFACIPDPIPGPETGEVVGIDRGVAVTAALSTGELLRVPYLSPARQARHARLQRKLASVEDLNIKNMTRSARGTAEAPGRNVRQKAGLNREISRSGWGLLIGRLDDKAPGRVQKVNPAYTSKRCSKCGHTTRESRKSQALYLCVACGYTGNADVNAARNTAAGHAVTARGGDGRGQPANREPQHGLLAS